MVKIFVISLKRSEERKKNITKQMNDFDLEYEFFDAVDGADLTQFQESYVNRLKAMIRLGRSLENGEIGCAFSHFNVYQKIVSENISDAIVLEDDAILSQEFCDLVKNKKLPSLGKDFVFMYSSDVFVDKVEKIDNKHSLLIPYVNPSSTLAYYINNTMAYSMCREMDGIDYVADYGVSLNSLGDVAIIKPDVISHDDENESCIENSRRKLMWWRYTRRKVFLEYILNRKNYTNITNYFKMVFLKKGLYRG